MFKDAYCRDVDDLILSLESKERLRQAMREEKPVKKNVIRTFFLAAALCAALVGTALAVELTVGWESFLGRTPKEAVTAVGVSSVTGDYTLTLQESIVDEDGAAFLLALARSDTQALEGKPQLYHWDVKVAGEFPNMSSESHQPILSDDRKTAYYCVEFETQGKEWDKECVTGKTITFQCDGVVDTDWSEEELSMTKEMISLAPLTKTARQIDLSYAEICRGENEQLLMELVDELSSQATVPLSRIGPKSGQISAVFFSNDGCPMVAISGWSGAIRQGQYQIGYGIATTLTDTRTGEQWQYKSATQRGNGKNEIYLSGFNSCPLTLESLPYMEVTIQYSMDKILSDKPAELSFVAENGYQTTVALDEDIAFNYIGDCTAHITGANISALRLQLTLDRMERTGWNWEDHKVRETPWALVEEDGTRVLLSSPIIRWDEETGAGCIRLEGINENYDRRLIDLDKVSALLVGEILIPLM